MIFTETDLRQFLAKGLTKERVINQITLFKKGIPFIDLEREATINDGILKLEESRIRESIKIYDENRSQLDIIKFVPASGAATRMFKDLFEFLKAYNPEEESINSYINKNKAKDLKVFLVGLEKLPFFEEVVTKLHKTIPDFNELHYDLQRYEFIKAMLDEKILNFSYFPKGLLPFHRYQTHVSTAFEEHLFEAAAYASSNSKANLHFTISEIHKDKFDREFMHIEEDVELKTRTEFDISFSYQKQSTDTIAVNQDNVPARSENGDIIFRPSGHGALLENLNDINADIIFIKNIDNVVVNKYEKEIVKYKKLLAGVLINVQNQVFEYLRILHDLSNSETYFEEIIEFASKELNVVVNAGFRNKSISKQAQYLINKLNRPIRVCGMVENEGEPGGGPFWVNQNDGEISLQIVETAQINKKDEGQKEILKNSTHFNPVDLVCGIKDFRGNKFDLTQFVDYDTAFITMKTKTGKHIKALERPGLWNGSMAHWNTIFVEVPLITFNPVKTVNDLLKPAHQVK